MLSDIEKDKLKDDIVRASGIHPSRIFNIFLFGSRVYGTANSKSDWDVIMVANRSVESTEIRNGLFNIHIYTPDKFKSDLEWHRINNLECIFAPDWAILKEDIDYRAGFKIDANKLRHATSHISSNSWIKSKKKIDTEYQIGIKSLFHSLRIPMFSIDIIENGKITDFSCANWIWEKLSKSGDIRWSWVELCDEFKILHNNILTDFRKLAKK
jgi:predicted nucleotidyltransferase